MRSITLLIRSFVIRDLTKNWIRSLLTVAGIALGVAVMLAINLANGSTLTRFKESIDLVAGKANLEIHSIAGADVDEHVLERLRSLWDEQVLFTPVVDQQAVVPGVAPDVVQVLGVDMFADPAFRAFNYRSSGGQSDLNSIFNRGVVYAGERFVSKHHLRVGDSFKIMVNDRYETVKLGSVIQYSGPGKTFGGNILLMDIGPAQMLFAMQATAKAPGRITRIDLLAPQSQVDRVQNQLRSMLPAALAVDPPSRRGRQVEKMLRAFQYNLTALSFIALLVGMFVIYNTMSITVIRKRTEVGVLRAIGASKQRIFWLFAVHAALLGSMGSALGVGLGLLFARYAVAAVSTTVQALYVDQPAAAIVVAPQTLAISFAFGLLMTFAAALAPILEAVSVAPAEAARRASFERRVDRASGRLALIGLLFAVVAAIASILPAINGLPICGYLSAALTIFAVAFCLPWILSVSRRFIQALAKRLFGTEGNLAIASLSSALGRTSVTIASLMLGIAMMASLGIMIGSFRETVTVWVHQSLKADLYVAPLSRAASKRTGRLSDETVARVRSIPGVQDVDAFVEQPIEYRGNATTLGAGDMDVLARHGGLMLVGGQNSRSVLDRLQTNETCIVSESFALRNNVKIGDTLQLQGQSGPFTVRVEGIYYDYASENGYVIVSRPLYRRHFADMYSSTLGVYTEPDADVDEVRSRLVQALGTTSSVSIRTNRELRKEVLRIFDNTFAITYALHVISILVAILGVMNALFALTFEMRREFAILSYLGASVQQIRKIILVQAGTLGLLGNVFGLSVGFLLSLLLINVINKQSFGWTVQLAIPGVFLLQSFILIMVSSLISGWLPARAATKSITPEAVRIE